MHNCATDERAERRPSDQSFETSEYSTSSSLFTSSSRDSGRDLRLSVSLQEAMRDFCISGGETLAGARDIEAFYALRDIGMIAEGSKGVRFYSASASNILSGLSLICRDPTSVRQVSLKLIIS
jgi:hypothetical protein